LISQAGIRIAAVRSPEKRVLAVIGQGYVGLPLAMAAVDGGWTVIGVDVSVPKVAEINQGSSPVEDVSDLQLQTAVSSGAYRATNDFAVVESASVIVICVPTPLDPKREPDLKSPRRIQAPCEM
jgi:UDP-N-acetyl-D-mannosaminuronate dehydrogenase